MTGTPRKRTALVTGASAGIGAAFSRILAERGIDLVLTARRADRLEVLARELRERWGVEARALPADLADPGAPARLHGELAAAGVEVDILVNNAGYGLPNRFVDHAWQEHDAFVRVMVTAVAELTHRFLEGMLERGYGRIVNVASLAGLLPAPAGHTLYAASKAFVVRFSQALALEVRPRGVHVTALCPGFTYSEFHDVSRTRDLVSRLPGWLWMDAETVAREGVEAVMAGRIICVTGGVNRWMARLAGCLPESLVLRAMQRDAVKFRRV
jgi:uncharacterized protein